jgi:hypothetical protein
MPFTPAHSAIVLPLLKKRSLSATTLVVGSMAPDFEYFFTMSVDSEHSHTLAGLLYFNVPVVFFLSFIFHQVVKKNLILNLPTFFASKFEDTLRVNFYSIVRGRPLIFILSSILGAASHLFWDSFTHEDGYFVQKLWFYEGTIVPYEGARYPLFYALQHISTYAGLFFVGIYILFKRRSALQTKPSFLYWTFVMLVTISLVYIRFLVQPNDYQIGSLVVTTISSLCIALVLAAALPVRDFTPSRLERDY